MTDVHHWEHRMTNTYTVEYYSAWKGTNCQHMQKKIWINLTDIVLSKKGRIKWRARIFVVRFIYDVLEQVKPNQGKKKKKSRQSLPGLGGWLVAAGADCLKGRSIPSGQMKTFHIMIKVWFAYYRHLSKIVRIRFMHFDMSFYPPPQKK